MLGESHHIGPGRVIPILCLAAASYLIAFSVLGTVTRTSSETVLVVWHPDAPAEVFEWQTDYLTKRRYRMDSVEVIEGDLYIELSETPDRVLFPNLRVVHGSVAVYASCALPEVLFPRLEAVDANLEFFGPFENEVVVLPPTLKTVGLLSIAESNHIVRLEFSALAEGWSFERLPNLQEISYHSHPTRAMNFTQVPRLETLTSTVGQPIESIGILRVIDASTRLFDNFEDLVSVEESFSLENIADVDPASELFQELDVMDGFVAIRDCDLVRTGLVAPNVREIQGTLHFGQDNECPDVAHQFPRLNRFILDVELQRYRQGGCDGNRGEAERLFLENFERRAADQEFEEWIRER
jgi:hypothetical protein